MSSKLMSEMQYNSHRFSLDTSRFGDLSAGALPVYDSLLTKLNFRRFYTESSSHSLSEHYLASEADEIRILVSSLPPGLRKQLFANLTDGCLSDENLCKVYDGKNAIGKAYLQNLMELFMGQVNLADFLSVVSHKYIQKLESKDAKPSDLSIFSNILPREFYFRDPAAFALQGHIKDVIKYNLPALVEYESLPGFSEQIKALSSDPVEREKLKILICDYLELVRRREAGEITDTQWATIKLGGIALSDPSIPNNISLAIEMLDMSDIVLEKEFVKPVLENIALCISYEELNKAINWLTLLPRDRNFPLRLPSAILDFFRNVADRQGIVKEFIYDTLLADQIDPGSLSCAITSAKYFLKPEVRFSHEFAECVRDAALNLIDCGVALGRVKALLKTLPDSRQFEIIRDSEVADAVSNSIDHKVHAFNMRMTRLAETVQYELRTVNEMDDFYKRYKSFVAACEYFSIEPKGLKKLPEVFHRISEANSPLNGVTFEDKASLRSLPLSTMRINRSSWLAIYDRAIELNESDKRYDKDLSQIYAGIACDTLQSVPGLWRNISDVAGLYFLRAEQEADALKRSGWILKALFLSTKNLGLSHPHVTKGLREYAKVLRKIHANDESKSSKLSFYARRLESFAKRLDNTSGRDLAADHNLRLEKYLQRLLSYSNAGEVFGVNKDFFMKLAF